MSDDYSMPDGDPDSDIKSGAAWVKAKVEECPVVPLGFEGGFVRFVMPEGEMRREPAAKIAGMLKTDIFASFEGRQFLAQWRDDEGKLQRDMAAQWFNQACRDAGRWDPNRPVRGYGVWPTAAGPIVHVGDALGYQIGTAAAEWLSIADALRADRRGPVWRLAAPGPRPGKPASVEDATKLRELLDLWRFQRMGDGGLTYADALTGWLGTALLGAVAPFRPHVSVVGGAGAGKTTLSMLIAAAGSANGGDLLDSFSEAGLRNSLSGEARAVFLDEAEPSTDGQKGPVEQAMELLRRMSTGEGSNRRQGDVGGTATGQSAVGSAYLAGISPIAVGDAMASRMFQIWLGKLGPAKGGMDDRIREGLAWAREISPSLLARAVRDHGRYLADVKVLRAAFGRVGQGYRASDLVSALAAGRRLLLFDEPLTPEVADVEASQWLPLMVSREEASSTTNPGQACLQRIFAIATDKHSHDRRLTVMEVLLEEVDSPTTHDKLLKAMGLRVENNHPGHERPGPWLIVSTNHPRLQRELKGTEYANWSGTLHHLSDLGEGHAPRSLPKPVRFGLHQSRAVAVPLAPWVEKPVRPGVSPAEATPFDPPDWAGRFGPADWDGADEAASHDPYHGETHD